eukprot:Clim_evm1s112 gene=Clim_evmTU1s112
MDLGILDNTQAIKSKLNFGVEDVIAETFECASITYEYVVAQSNPAFSLAARLNVNVGCTGRTALWSVTRQELDRATLTSASRAVTLDSSCQFGTNSGIPFFGADSSYVLPKDSSFQTDFTQGEVLLHTFSISKAADVIEICKFQTEIPFLAATKIYVASADGSAGLANVNYRITPPSVTAFCTSWHLFDLSAENKFDCFSNFYQTNGVGFGDIQIGIDLGSGKTASQTQSVWIVLQNRFPDSATPGFVRSDNGNSLPSFQFDGDTYYYLEVNVQHLDTLDTIRLKDQSAVVVSGFLTFGQGLPAGQQPFGNCVPHNTLSVCTIDEKLVNEPSCTAIDQTTGSYSVAIPKGGSLYIFGRPVTGKQGTEASQSQSADLPLNENDVVCAAASFLPNSTVSCGPDLFVFTGDRSELKKVNPNVEVENLNARGENIANRNLTSISQYYHAQSVEISLTGANFRATLRKPLAIDAAASSCDSIQSGGATVVITAKDQTNPACAPETVSWNFFSNTTIYLPAMSYSVVLQQYNRFPADTTLELATRSSFFFGPRSKHTRQISLVSNQISADKPLQISWIYYSLPQIKTVSLLDGDGNDVQPTTSCRDSDPPINYVVKSAKANYTLAITLEEQYAYGQTCEYLTAKYQMENFIDFSACSNFPEGCSGSLNGTSSISHKFQPIAATRDAQTALIALSVTRQDSYSVDLLLESFRILITGIRNRGGGPRASPVPLNINTANSDISVPDSCQGIANLTNTYDEALANYLETAEINLSSGINSAQSMNDVNSKVLKNSNKLDLNSKKMSNHPDEKILNGFSDLDREIFQATASTVISELNNQAFVVLRKPPGDQSTATLSASVGLKYAVGKSFDQGNSITPSGQVTLRFGVDDRGTLTVVAPFGLGVAADLGARNHVNFSPGLAINTHSEYGADISRSVAMGMKPSWTTAVDLTDSVSGWWIDDTDPELFGSPRDAFIFTPLYFAIAVNWLVSFDEDTCSLLQTPIPVVKVDRPSGNDDFGFSDYTFILTEQVYAQHQLDEAQASLASGILSPDEVSLVEDSIAGLQCEVDYFQAILDKYEGLSKVALHDNKKGVRYYVDNSADAGDYRLTDFTPIFPSTQQWTGDTLKEYYDYAKSGITSKKITSTGELVGNPYFTGSEEYKKGSSFLAGPNLADSQDIRGTYYQNGRFYDIERIAFTGGHKYDLSMSKAFKVPGVSVSYGSASTIGGAVEVEAEYGGGFGPVEVRFDMSNQAGGRAVGNRRRSAEAEDVDAEAEEHDIFLHILYEDGETRVLGLSNEEAAHMYRAGHEDPGHIQIMRRPGAGAALKAVREQRKKKVLPEMSIAELRHERQRLRERREQRANEHAIEQIKQMLHDKRPLWTHPEHERKQKMQRREAETQDGNQFQMEASPVVEDDHSEHLARQRRAGASGIDYAMFAGAARAANSWSVLSRGPMANGGLKTNRFGGGGFNLDIDTDWGMAKDMDIQREQSTSLTLHLEDKDPGDAYDFEIYTDENGLPVYKILAGQSMCMNYPVVTFARQEVHLDLVDGLPADRSDQPVAARVGQVFKFRLRNDGPVDREYTDEISLYPITTRRTALVFKVANDYFRSATQGRNFNWRLNRQEYTDFWLEVTLDPNADVAGVISGVQIRAEPMCDRNLHKIVEIAVNLVPDCPSIQITNEATIPSALGRSVLFNNGGGASLTLVLENPQSGHAFQSWNDRFSKALGSNMLQTGIEVTYTFDRLKDLEPGFTTTTILYAIKSLNDPCTASSAVIACWNEDSLVFYLGSDDIDASQVPSNSLPAFSIDLTRNFIQIEVRTEDMAAVRLPQLPGLLSASTTCDSEVQSSSLSSSPSYLASVDYTSPNITDLLSPAEEFLSVQGPDATDAVVLLASEPVICTYVNSKVQLLNESGKGDQIKIIGVDCVEDVVIVTLPLNEIATQLKPDKNVEKVTSVKVIVDGLRDLNNNPLVAPYELSIPVHATEPGLPLLQTPPPGVVVVLRGVDATQTIVLVFKDDSLACEADANATFNLLITGETETKPVTTQAVSCVDSRVTVTVPVKSIEDTVASSSAKDPVIKSADLVLDGIVDMTGLSASTQPVQLTVDSTPPTLQRILYPPNNSLSIYNANGAVDYDAAVTEILLQFDEIIDCSTSPTAVIELMDSSANSLASVETGVSCTGDVVTVVMPLNDLSAQNFTVGQNAETVDITISNLRDVSQNSAGDIQLLPDSGFTLVVITPADAPANNRRRSSETNHSAFHNDEDTKQNDPLRDGYALNQRTWTQWIISLFN